MKKLGTVLLALLLLTGCGAASYEQVQDVYATQPLSAPAQLLVSLPPDATVMAGEDSSLWLCDGYTAAASTLEAGDLDATLRAVTGYGREQLEVLELEEAGLKRYECVWISAGEGGDQVARTVVLDDGSYHYTLTLQTEAAQAGALRETWQQVLGTVTLDIVP